MTTSYYQRCQHCQIQVSVERVCLDETVCNLAMALCTHRCLLIHLFGMPLRDRVGGGTVHDLFDMPLGLLAEPLRSNMGWLSTCKMMQKERSRINDLDCIRISTRCDDLAMKNWLSCSYA